MDKEARHSKSPAASFKNCKAYGVVNPNPRLYLRGPEDSPDPHKGSNSRRQVYIHLDEEEFSLDSWKTSSDEAKSSSDEDIAKYPGHFFNNLAPLKTYGLDDPLFFDSGSEYIDEKHGDHKFDRVKGKLRLVDSDSDHGEEFQPVAETKKACDEDKQNSTGFAAMVRVSNEADAKQEMTFTDSESEEEESAVEFNAIKTQEESEKVEMTFTDSESESEVEEPPNTDTNHGFKVLESSGFQPRKLMTFTDSESEDDLPPVANEIGLEQVPATHLNVLNDADTEQEMTFTDSESEDEESEPATDCNVRINQVQPVEEEMTFTDSESESEDEESSNIDTNASKIVELLFTFQPRKVMAFTDSESEDDVPMAVNPVEKASKEFAIVEKMPIPPNQEDEQFPAAAQRKELKNSASSDPNIEELTFTDSESEDDLPSVGDETEREQLPEEQHKAEVDQEMTFTDSESEGDEEPEPTALKTKVQPEKEEMTFTDSESEPEDDEPPNADTSNSKMHPSCGTHLKEPITFTDSESEGEQPTGENLVEKASDNPKIEELTFTDSESEEEY